MEKMRQVWCSEALDQGSEDCELRTHQLFPTVHQTDERRFWTATWYDVGIKTIVDLKSVHKWREGQNNQVAGYTETIKCCTTTMGCKKWVLEHDPHKPSQASLAHITWALLRRQPWKQVQQLLSLSRGNWERVVPWPWAGSLHWRVPFHPSNQHHHGPTEGAGEKILFASWSWKGINLTLNSVQ